MQVRKPMKLRKTHLALATLAVFGAGAVAVKAQTSSIIMEAESMSLSSYVKENTRIKTSSPRTTGTATKSFSGTSGTYNVEVHVVPESDGASTLELYKGSTLLQSYKYPLSSTPASFTVSGVALKAGETIKLIGRPSGGMARVDKIAFTPVSTSPTAPTTSEPVPATPGAASMTIEAEGMSLSSYVKENTRIKTSSPRSTGTATKTFSGASGTYDVQVHVVPEADGGSTLELYKSSTLLRSYQYPLSATPTSFTVGNVALKSGEPLKLVGRAAGGMARVDKIVLTPTATSTPTSPAPDTYTYSGTPYTGSPIAVPKAVVAVNFDKGGQGVAYKDLSAGNAGSLYRTSEDVDITSSGDAESGGYAVNQFQTGEWLAYTLNVPANGAYDLAVKASNNQSTPATFHMEIDGKDVSGPITVPDTGGWDTYKWIGKPGVNLAAGKRILKVVSDQQYFNINAVSVLASGTTAPTTPAPSYGLYFKTPATGATLSGSVNSSGCEVAGTGLASVKFSVDATALNTDSSAPWQCAIDTLKLSNGAHTLKAVATYTDGTTGSAQVSVNVDNDTPPILGDAVDGIARPASLLFWSGFESTGLGAPFDCYSNGCWQEFTGGDLRTGFNWPPKVFGSESRSRFQLLVDGPAVTPSSIDEYMRNEIQSVIGPKGRSTRALFTQIKKTGCCGTNVQDGSGVTQNPYVLSPTKEVPELYVSYWVKLQPDLVEQMQSGTWRNLFEWKTSDTDRRVLLQVLSHGGTPYWRAVLDQRIEPKHRIWEVSNKTIPVPAGEWFKVEVYWKRSGGSDGRVWMAINGKVIADKFGSNMGPNKSPINRIFAPILYSGGTSPMHQWVDDMQIWSTFPKAKAGDPWYDAPYAPR